MHPNGKLSKNVLQGWEVATILEPEKNLVHLRFAVPLRHWGPVLHFMFYLQIKQNVCIFVKVLYLV